VVVGALVSKLDAHNDNGETFTTKMWIEIKASDVSRVLQVGRS
jgi:hypothetical protein